MKKVTIKNKYTQHVELEFKSATTVEAGAIKGSVFIKSGGKDYTFILRERDIMIVDELPKYSETFGYNWK